ncbi:hypothetical protein PsYK624_097190 [Phanerochaete sordida]|uniref:Uncharacterized protein n=1 Tax=Phanerochaete sordida TaxID=48140 RepID=A0A9P3GEW0_9APHY|nr:hypothetical protein PsYK624_097190 [Phanerochaete sordida]
MSYPRIKAGSKVMRMHASPRIPTPAVQAPPPSSKEITIMTKRRMEKAERDERVDITKALTPVKTYMGGFTRPQDLRVSNWWPGGAYIAKGKVYEAPPPAAYEPHTVFLLEARYLTRHGVGRQDSIEYVVGVCREGDLPDVLAKYNSWSCDKEQLEIMDNAVWPWIEKKKKKSVVWWDKTESRSDVLARRHKEIFEAPLPDEVAETSTAAGDLASAPSPPASASRQTYIQTRAYHSSAPSRSDSDEKTRTTPSERAAEIPTSAWSRPHKPSQDADDDVVPAYYVERRRQLDEIAERKEAEGGLMAQLSAGILSEGIAAQTRPREEKIPPEVVEEDGTVRLPSGFEPPTPATEFHPVAALPAVETDDPVVKLGNITWEEALAPSDAEADAEAVDAAASGSSSPASRGVRGFHTSAVARAREVPLPDLDSHAASSSQRPLKRLPKDSAPVKPKQAPFSVGAKNEEQEDGDDFFLEGDDVVEEVGGPVSPIAETVRDFNSQLHEYREQYMKTLKEEPFWRPVLTATFSTRSLALTYARLSRALPRGLPFYASIDEADRKYGPTFNSRMRQLRVRRMRQLALDIARRLRGDFGGFPGIRFSPSDRGRTLGGEGLEAPIPSDKRTVLIGVAGWDSRGEELREVTEQEIAELELDEGFNVFSLDQWGRRMDGVEWRRPQAPITTKALSRALDNELEGLSPRERKLKTLEITEREGRKIAFALSQKNRNVHYPHKQQMSLKQFDAVEVPAAIVHEPKGEKA